MVPPDTMTLNKESLRNFGLTDIGAFVSNRIDHPTSLKRIINPNKTSGVYVIRLFMMQKSGSEKLKWVKGGGVTRAGFSFKGQNLIYTLNGKEFSAGNINFKHLTLKNYRKVGI
ncbi:MAG: hypothetical protein REI78_04640 [Pedobacter sp.]|nr:hypothetical protein [Pedobacter sp.]